MLLIVEALLFLAALRQDHRVAAAGEIALDMVPDSVDDQYDGCTKEMEELVEKEYLKKELNESQKFKDAWKAGEEEFQKEYEKLKRNYLIAIYVYTLDGRKPLYIDFNNEVRNGTEKYKNKTFRWYSLHFLLTKALQILKKQQNTRFLTIYRGTSLKFKGEKGKKFRFGSFTSFSLNQGVAQEFARVSDSGTCFEIKNYEGAEVSKYSRYPDEKEVLIPPYEKFEVTDVKTNDWCNTVFVLKSAGEKSNLNCALFKTNILSKLFGCCGKR